MHKDKDKFKIFYAISFAWQLGFIIAIPIVGFGILGFLADNFFKTEPLFLIVSIIVSIIITIYETYHMLTPFTKKR